MINNIYNVSYCSQRNSFNIFLMIKVQIAYLKTDGLPKLLYKIDNKSYSLEILINDYLF